MSRNGSGVYSLPPQYQATTGETITALQHNLPLTDIAADLNAVRPVASGGTGANTASGARSSLGLAIGSDVQGYDALLKAIADLTVAADQIIYATGASSVAATALTSFARTILDDADAAAVQATLGVPPNGRTVSAAGLATGGGDLSANRTITVTEASSSEATTGTASDVVMTPRRVQDALDALIYTGSTQNNLVFPVGSYLWVNTPTVATRNQTYAIYLSGVSDHGFTTTPSGTALTGTWRARGARIDGTVQHALFQRTA